MNDAYTPALNDFALTAAETGVITSMLATAKPWDCKKSDPLYTAVQAIKKRIEEFHLKRHNDQCCYCRRYLGGAGHFMIDREHVLPKSKPAYLPLSFTIWNLGVSCKRCNMQYKKERVDFVVDDTNVAARLLSTNYLLIHPNFDKYQDHIGHSLNQEDGITVQKFTTRAGSDKAEYTYTFFDLRGLEIDGFDDAQGAMENEEILGEGALEARALAEQFGQ
ncbi:HNH endonuclease [Sulfitobacter geojensis]|uniref:HNH nuclease domain-containing protein n=1 Tax=Sulfitobacter geojensis TaxID=1342299 RepID=A0AAE3B5V3_9RHOB|nr:hypothetical protein [Sulfitobacter geojensis]MBM1689281.1 hypothetical protein [Sulfitobacter geojensis]MBM1693347.1 hypothetical protein [Sulfitobacter geojensis]MBM1705513.1 hypothetical protein [Sulfitobacter geojensis]MBM1709571.1 hypothetical protein [Sulfitobacter geojensis]MBM1713637.1 hypothetical protein [Sulfitobacter geojensis]